MFVKSCCSRGFLFKKFKNISGKHLCKSTKYKRDGLQSGIGLKITKDDRAELQITVSFGPQIATNVLKIGLPSAMGLQGVTSLDCTFRRDFKAQQITNWYSTTVTEKLDGNALTKKQLPTFYQANSFLDKQFSIVAH